MERRSQLKQNKKVKTNGIMSDPFIVKTIICTVLSFAVMGLARINKEPISNFKSTLRKYIGSGADCKAAVEVIGRCISEPDGFAAIFDSEAIKVFGAQIISPYSDSDNISMSENEPDNSEENIEQDNYVQQDIAAEENKMPIQFADTDLSEQTFMAVQANSVSVNAVPTLLSSSNPFVVSLPEQLEQISLLREEVIDNTPATEFAKPTPAVVDDAIYVLPFKYDFPIKGVVTSPFGYRIHPITGKYSFHYGVDISAKKGDKIASFADGTVLETGKGTVYGNYVKVQHSGGYWTRYCHLNKISVKKGQKIKLGEKIGEAGSTGWSTGVHLHFELRKNDRILNPMQYLKF